MYLDQIITAQRHGTSQGITSICSAHPSVLRAAMKHASQTGAPLLIESTCNQVNQFGGYTGMQPHDFVKYVHDLAKECDFPIQNLLLGGDHLGPNVWQEEPAQTAMEKSVALTQAYVQSGYVKIHLDTSMRVADDPAGALEPETIAKRAAVLAQAAEASKLDGSPAPRYVIGTEVPVPGGATDEEEGVVVTSKASVTDTIDLTKNAFLELGLEEAWERVIAVVVQPGVEFGDEHILPYKSAEAKGLTEFIQTKPFIYEAHSTDYQTRAALKNLVTDQFAILKVGPGLTFAFREAVFALAMIEKALVPVNDQSNIVDVLENAMLASPGYWKKYYSGSPAEIAFKRQYSLSDRVRYYWTQPDVQKALQQLLKNLNQPIPLVLLSQYMPPQYALVRQGNIEPVPEALIQSKIEEVLADYHYAVSPNTTR